MRSVHQEHAGQKTWRSGACPSHALRQKITHLSDRTAFVCRCCHRPWPRGEASALRKTRHPFMGIDPCAKPCSMTRHTAQRVKAPRRSLLMSEHTDAGSLFAQFMALNRVAFAARYYNTAYKDGQRVDKTQKRSRIKYPGYGGRQ